MTYSLTAGGKRIRPILCLLGGKTFGANPIDILPMALACEMVHTASLIHDDLPSMTMTPSGAENLQIMLYLENHLPFWPVMLFFSGPSATPERNF